MQIGVWSFQPGLVPTLAVLATLPLLLTLGFWQIDRADQKQALFDSYEHRYSLEPVDLNRETSFWKNTDEMLWRRCVVSGKYADSSHFLLDNQVLNGRAGYFIFAPFQIDQTDTWVLVNRGWIPAGDYRDSLPDIDMPRNQVPIKGIAKHPQTAGILLSEHQTEEHMGNGIIRMQNIDLNEIEKIIGHALLPYVIRLETGSPTAYTTTWPRPGSGMEKHLGYAFQWFALAAVLLVLYIYTNTRRRPAA